MKFLKFIHDIFKKYPLLLLINTVLLIFVSLSGMGALFTVGPLVDFFIHPDLQNASPLTMKAVGILEFFNVPVTLGNWLFIFIVFVVCNAAFQVFAQHSILRTKYIVIKDLVLGTFEDFLNARWRFFSSNRQGTILNTFSRELNIVGQAFGAMASFFSSTIQMLFFISVPFYISWQVTIISITVAGLFAIPFVLLGKYSYKLGKVSTATANTYHSILLENMGAAKVLLGFGNQQSCRNALDGAFDTHQQAAIKAQTLNLSIPIVYRPLAVIMVVIALFAARWFAVPLSEITVLLLALFQVAISLGNITSQKNMLENFVPSYEQVKHLRQQACEMRQTSGQKMFEGFDHSIDVKDVTFSYPDNEPVLKDINVKIQKGKMVALVGKSGSGKSTLIDLVMEFYEPATGSITIDGTPLSEFNVISYRKRIGYVPQESTLFNMTIKDNLLWAKSTATDEEIREACRLAYADEFIDRFPEKYETLVGDRGVRLSGGQNQRIALARALLREPDLLILDEATSALDTHSERLIQKAIENIAKKTTVVVVAHRLSTIKNADVIYVIDNGNIIEQGTYADLTGKDGYFSSMVQFQELDAAH